jgi:hypothetical protein
MYFVLGIDAVLRITAALLFLFVAVPALARRRPAELDRMQWFWWCLACGATLLTITGQLLMLLNLFNTATLLLAIAALVLIVRARVTGRAASAILHDLYRSVVLFSLNVLEGRVNLKRRFRRAIKRLTPKKAEELRGTPRKWLPWTAVILVAAAVRLYRPFASANLGFSDTYVHLYLMRLLEQGRQVDPAWGPYPRGMHFLLHAIRELTNVDAILLMNFFGPIAGVLMTLAVADTARRLTGRLGAGVVAGLIFATMVGGASQYFLFGGSMATDRVRDAREFVQLSYREIPPTSAEFDVLLTVFQRQTATLPQELAIVFLFPAAMFLFCGAQASRQPSGEVLAPVPEGGGTPLAQPAWTPALRWHFTGYLFCTSAIAAIHSGVVVPLVLLSGVTVLITRRHFVRAMVLGALGILIGSTWMLGYIAYPNVGARDIDSASGVASGALYYFPFLRGGELARIVTYVAITPFVIACLALALILLLRRQRAIAWASAATIVFLFTHVASRFGWPEIVEVRRNAAWLAMAVAILLGVAMAELMRWKAGKIAATAMVIAWMITVPLSGVQHKLLNYSGYSATAFAVIEIQRKLEPFTWTLVTYGQEFPMVLGKGFHLAAADFLEKYDPAERKLEIPTRYVFIAVEKNPHPFQINTWATKFSRADVQQRLQTWCFLYQLNHRDMRVFMDDENVRVYVIERDPGVEVGAL